jgi:2-keto-4-pentenoate hydratase/2-oxohepta-3-ene-1,7-dioic acid hydratase in catechol pathway
MKPPSTTKIGPGDPLLLCRNSNWVDWEVKLAMVIGEGGRNISGREAEEHIFEYTILNDVSEREFNAELPDRFMREKERFMDWLHGKWFESFAPMGPAVVTKDEIPDPHDLAISLCRNGEIQQKANTAQMIHEIPYLIHKLSEIMTLEPGDVIATATPSGVGHSKGLRLEPGDVIECCIEAIGVLENPVRAEGAESAWPRSSKPRV